MVTIYITSEIETRSAVDVRGIDRGSKYPTSGSSKRRRERTYRTDGLGRDPSAVSVHRIRMRREIVPNARPLLTSSA